MRKFSGKILLLLVVLALQTSFLAAHFYVEPRVSCGLENNDNIDLVSNNAVGSASFLINGGVDFSSYFSPDALLLGSIDYYSNNFMEKGFGGFSSLFVSSGLYYDILHNLTLSESFSYEIFNDSVNSSANYNDFSFGPKLAYFLTPYTSLGLLSQRSSTFYPEGSELSHSNKFGGYIDQQLSSITTISLGTYSLDSISNVVSSNYFGQLTNLGINILLGNKSDLFIGYDTYNLKYPEWFVDRKDVKSIFSLVLGYDIDDNTSLKFNYENIKNNSTDDQNDFQNNVLSIAINAQFSIGDKYPDGHASEIDYFFAEAVAAIDNQQYGKAERLLKKTSFWIEEDPDVLFELGFLYHKQAKYKKAVKYFEKTLLLDSNKIEAGYLLAYDYLKLGYAPKAKVLLLDLWEKTGDEKIENILKVLADEEN